MFHQISWTAYGITVFIMAVIYYLIIGLNFYKTELLNFFNGLTGRAVPRAAPATGELPLPDYSIVGSIRNDDIDYVPQEELAFGPAEGADEELRLSPQSEGIRPTDLHLAASYSEMNSEVKTLVRVVNESGEPKENFELLFRLIVQKYPELAGPAFEKQVIDYLLNECAAELPFPINEQELKMLWLNDNKLQTT